MDARDTDKISKYKELEAKFRIIYCEDIDYNSSEYQEYSLLRTEYREWKQRTIQDIERGWWHLYAGKEPYRP